MKPDVDFKKRSRSANWESDEKHLLLELLKKRSKILEDKNTNSKALKVKNDTWEEISKVFLLSGKKRDRKQLKEQWRRMKREARIRIFNYKKHITGTNDESKDEPTEQDWTIYGITPDDFIDDSGQNIPQHIVKAPIKNLINPIVLHPPSICEPELRTDNNSNSTPVEYETQEMSRYEKACFKEYKKKIDEEIEMARELHELRMEWERKIFEEKLTYIKEKRLKFKHDNVKEEN